MLFAPVGLLGNDDLCPNQTSRNLDLKDTKSIDEHESRKGFQV
jgi:hypothetical protein